MDCSVAHNLSRLGLRKQAFPFDWLRINDINVIMSLLKSRFQFLFDKEYLVEDLSKDSTKFPTLIESDTIDTVDTDSTVSHPIVKNTKLNITFFHDFKTTLDNPDSYSDTDLVIEKYNRRIDRLYQILFDENIPKVFVRLSRCKTDKRLFTNFIKKMNYKNCRLIHILVDKKTLESCESRCGWKKEELDWIDFLNKHKY